MILFDMFMNILYVSLIIMYGNVYILHLVVPALS